MLAAGPRPTTPRAGVVPELRNSGSTALFRLNHVLQLQTEQGAAGFAEGLHLLVNKAMRVERHQVLHTQPYEHTNTRQGYVNGYQPKTITSRLGPITFRVPQVRE
jgi:transposase-like protein